MNKKASVQRLSRPIGAGLAVLAVASLAGSAVLWSKLVEVTERSEATAALGARFLIFYSTLVLALGWIITLVTFRFLPHLKSSGLIAAPLIAIIPTTVRLLVYYRSADDFSVGDWLLLLITALSIPGEFLLRLSGRSGELVHSHFSVFEEQIQFVYFVPLNVIAWLSIMMFITFVLHRLRERSGPGNSTGMRA